MAVKTTTPRFERICGWKVYRISRYNPRGRWFRHIGTTIVEDHFGKLYRWFFNKVEVGSVVKAGNVIGLQQGLDELGQQTEWLRVLRAVDVSEVRAAMGSRHKLAIGHWYEVLAD